MSLRIRALAKHLECKASDISPAPYGEHTFYGPGRSEWLVLTDKQANQAAHAVVADGLWAFRPSFLAERCDLPEEVFKAIADNNKYESNNDTIRKLVDKLCPQGFYGFAEAAINADGRGNFLSVYDSEECEITISGRTFYLYRVN